MQSPESKARKLMLRKAAQIESYLTKINLALYEIRESEHPRAEEIAERLGNEGVGWLLSAEDCVRDWLDEE